MTATPYELTIPLLRGGGAGRLHATRRMRGVPAHRPRRGRSNFLDGVLARVVAAAERAGVDPETRDRLTHPERISSVEFAVRMDNGRRRRLRGWRVVHSTTRGAAKGGLRFAVGVDERTLCALAAEMPSKSAIYGLPLGGAKGGVDVDASQLSAAECARVMRGFVRATLDAGWQRRELAFGPDADAPAPDVGTTRSDVNLMDVAVDEFVGWIVEKGLRRVGRTQVPQSLCRIEAGGDTETPYVDHIIDLFAEGAPEALGLLATFTGKSIEKGGSRGRREATGLGVALTTLEMLKHRGGLAAGAKRFTGQTVAVQGFGNVGWGAAAAFTRLGARVVAIAEFDGEPYAIEKLEGFSTDDVDALEHFKATHGTLRDFPGTRAKSLDEFWALRVDVLAPCAREGVIDERVAARVGAKIVVEGANGPTTHAADAVLEGRGVTVVPDIFANAAGVTVSHFEMRQNLRGERWSLVRVDTELRGHIEAAFATLAAAQRRSGTSWRDAAMDSAIAALCEGREASRRAA